MNKKLHTLIFSKDRALQLDSLLRSIRDNYSQLPHEITVIYAVSDTQFEKGYELLKSREIIENISWVEESSFADNLRNEVTKIGDNSLIQFMVDDDIIFRPFDLSIIESFTEKDLTISLRVDPSYPRFDMPKMKTTDKFLRWNWYPLFAKRTGNFWYYPFSVDGNIFHASDIKMMMELIEFKAPNTFEGKMSTAKKKFLNKKTSIAPKQAVIFNNPMNSVQNEGETWNQNISAEELNQYYLDGKQIDNSELYKAEPNEVHFAVPLKLEEISK